LRVQRSQDVSAQGTARRQGLFPWQVLQRGDGTSCDRPAGYLFSATGGVRSFDKGMTIACKIRLASNAEKLTVPANIKLKEYWLICYIPVFGILLLSIRGVHVGEVR
jgi:hypothetical protein